MKAIDIFLNKINRMIIHLSSIVNTLLANFISNFGYVAQSVEHRSYKSAVVGSSPAIPTKIYFSEN